MTLADLQAQLATSNDRLQMTQNQRNAAQNECVQIAAELLTAQRKIMELENKVRALTPELPPTNGHATEARA